MNLRPSTVAGTQRKHIGNGRTTKNTMEDSTPPNKSLPPLPSKRQLGGRYVPVWIDRDLLQVENLLSNEEISISDLLSRLLEEYHRNRKTSEGSMGPAEKRFYQGKARGFSEAIKLVQSWKESL